MAASATNSGVVTFTIKVNGNVIPDQFSVLSVYVQKSLNGIPFARITILDGEPNTGTFPVSSSATFVPGAEVVIEAGYDLNDQLIFKGIITAQNIRIDDTIGSALDVECYDAVIRMSVGRKNLSFANKKDSDIISSIIGTYSGLSADVTATTTQWPQQVQYNITDWDFICSRAEANSMVVNPINGKVSVIHPGANTTSVLTVAYGDNLMAFNASLDSLSQLANVNSSSWDPATQSATSATAANTVAGPGNIASKTLAQVVGLANYELQTTAPLPAADLANWSNAKMVKSEYAKIQGEAKFQGSPLAEPGTYITLNGLGDRFNGDHLVSAVTHDISDGNWITKVNIGLSPRWYSQQADILLPPAAELIPGARGLFNATVKRAYSDPDGQFRILVTVPMFDPNGEGIWARLSNFYATSGAGAFFLPEVGDEVILGFLNEDPRYPVILGSLYSNNKNQPYAGLAPDAKNSMKSIVSRSGIAVQFDDVNKVLTIQTPSKNTIALSDKNQSIAITDQNQNSITMSDSGISIKSSKNISFEADGNVTIKGSQGINATASGGDVTISGINIKETAASQYSAQGGMTTSITAGAQLTLKAAMVMIN